jgi:hypothetical protein
MRKRTKVKTKISHIEAHDECGNLVYFEMPFAAMYYETGHVTINDEERIQAKTEKLATEYCAKADKPDAMINDLDDKIKVVNRLERKGAWI